MLVADDRKDIYIKNVFCKKAKSLFYCVALTLLYNSNANDMHVQCLRKTLY